MRRAGRHAARASEAEEENVYGARELVADALRRADLIAQTGFRNRGKTANHHQMRLAFDLDRDREPIIDATLGARDWRDDVARVLPSLFK